jgi:hypothetical protein
MAVTGGGPSHIRQVVGGPLMILVGGTIGALAAVALAKDPDLQVG